MDSLNREAYSRYGALLKAQRTGGRLLAYFPPLPPYLVLGIQLLFTRLMRLDIARAVVQNEQYLKNIVTVKEGDAFIDVGASIGGWSIWASQRVGRTGIVLSLEPNHMAYEWLVKNIGEATNVVPLRVAAHRESGTIAIWTENNAMSSTMSKSTIGEYLPDLGRGHVKSVRAIRLDSLIPYLHESQAVVLKIDVEGAELDVLQGAAGMMSRVRTVVVEVHSKTLRQEVESFLSEQGFSIRFVSLSGQYPAHIIGSRSGTTPSSGEGSPSAPLPIPQSPHASRAPMV